MNGRGRKKPRANTDIRRKLSLPEGRDRLGYHLTLMRGCHVARK